MNTWLLSIVTICYAGTSLDYFIRYQGAWGIFWGCYAIANVAFIFATK